MTVAVVALVLVIVVLAVLLHLAQRRSSATIDHLVNALIARDPMDLVALERPRSKAKREPLPDGDFTGLIGT